MNKIKYPTKTEYWVKRLLTELDGYTFYMAFGGDWDGMEEDTLDSIIGCSNVGACENCFFYGNRKYKCIARDEYINSISESQYKELHFTKFHNYLIELKIEMLGL